MLASTKPRYLFRVWTDQSHGTSSSTSIKSAWPSWSPIRELMRISSAARNCKLRHQYQDALLSKPVVDNPFVFTACSLLYAIQHAIFKTRGSGETSTRIICIETATCRRTDGGVIHFYSATKLMINYGISTPRARWMYEERDYPDVLVTTNNIVPGKGSFHISFQALKDVGLFKLYREFAAINRRNNPGLESPVKDLRRLWYTQQRDFPRDELTLAAQLAAAFEPVLAHEESADVPSHLLAWFIALKGQRAEADGKHLLRWLHSHGSRPRSNFGSEGSRKSGIPEDWV